MSRTKKRTLSSVGYIPHADFDGLAEAPFLFTHSPGYDFDRTNTLPVVVIRIDDLPALVKQAKAEFWKECRNGNDATAMHAALSAIGIPASTKKGKAK